MDTGEVVCSPPGVAAVEIVCVLSLVLVSGMMPVEGVGEVVVRLKQMVGAVSLTKQVTPVLHVTSSVLDEIFDEGQLEISISPPVHCGTVGARLFPGRKISAKDTFAPVQ